MIGDEIITKADEVSRAAQQRIASVKADDRLSEQARQADIGEIRETARQRLAELAEQRDKAVNDEVRRLERKLSTPSQSLSGADRVALDVSYRDALERARAVDVGDRAALLTLFNDSARVGDELQQQAAMTVALDRGERDVVDAYLDEHPAKREDVEALVEVSNELTSLDRKFRVAGHFAVMF